MSVELCWICQLNEANSKEHLLKASDVRAVYGKVSPSEPIYFHNHRTRNIPVASAKTNRLKTKNVICRRCNDTVTQPFDRAWERFLAYTLKEWKAIRTTRRVKLHKAFPGSTRHNAILMHLFFVKLFGCRIQHEKLAIDLQPFRESIDAQRPHPQLFLIFTASSIHERGLPYSGVSEIHALTAGTNGTPLFATWYYSLSEFCIQVVWHHHLYDGGALPYQWHPSQKGKMVNVRAR
ncbi:hypothetical protein [Litorivivens sp.]|uniref:hypothetical protein n=1 Tax=Litorivivens sp. TaxID=2020868 RepID=UPI003566367E